MRSALVLASLVLLLAPALPAGAQTMASYDTFGTARIDPDKWIGLEVSQGQGSSSNEIFRRIVSGEAQLLLRATGNLVNNTSSTSPSNRLRVGHPKLMAGTPIIKALEARVKVMEASIDHCAGNTAVAGRVRAQLIGAFFNDGTGNNKAGDQTGDIRAGIQKSMDSNSPTRAVVAFINRCTDPACSAQTSVATVTFTRTWDFGVADVMRVTWQPSNNRFRFVIDGPGDPETRDLSYAGTLAADSAKPKRIFHDIAAAYTLQNCTAGAVQGFMDMRVDNVRLDQAAVDATQ